MSVFKAGAGVDGVGDPYQWSSEASSSALDLVLLAGLRLQSLRVD